MTSTSLSVGLSFLPVKYFEVIDQQGRPFERVNACFYRYTEEGVFEVLSLSQAEGSLALLNIEKFDGIEGVHLCVWGLNGGVVVAKCGMKISDLRLYEEGVFVDGIQLGAIQHQDSLARTQRLLYRGISG